MNEQKGSACPRCSTPFEPGQEYCMECGLRLTPVGAEAAEPALPPPPGEPPPRPNRSWIWAALAGFVVAAAGAAVAIAITGNGDGTTLTLTTTIAPVTQPPPATDTGAVVPPPTQSTTTSTVTVTIKPPTTSTSTTPTKPTLIAWPNRTAYTVVLVSLPAPGGHAAALARANQALAKGLPQVGVLDSAKFASLNPGYYVVFSGVYKTLLQAEAGSRNARFQGFGSAYPRQIKP